MKYDKYDVELPIIIGISAEQEQVPNIEVFPEEKLSELYVETFPADQVDKSNIMYIGDEGISKDEFTVSSDLRRYKWVRNNIKSRRVESNH